jgi:DNA modification methylase
MKPYYKNELTTIYNGDCLEVMDYLISQGVKVDAIITDPPYNISRDNNFKTMKDRKGRTGIDFGEWDKNADITSWIEKASKLLKISGNIIIFNSWENLSEIKEICELNDLHIKRPLVFHKSNPAPFNRDRLLVNDVEFGLWFVKGKRNSKKELKSGDWVFNRQDKLQSCVFKYVVESGGGFKKYHPTQKAVKQMEQLINIFTNKDDLILDCFSGSFTTSYASEQLNRRSIGIELEKKYCDVGVKRLSQLQMRMDI